jgi:hypothetical protein
MSETPGKTRVKKKRPSKGMAKYNRKVKQQQRKESIPGNDAKGKKK